jgi:ElaB/YqjD/DUF883 family membrane-anchored ribosome-binding protein
MASPSNAASDARDEIRKLRDQVDSLMRERVTPIISDAAGRAQDAARQAGEMAQDQAEALSNRVRETPLAAVLIAGAAGYLLGRITR